MSNRTKSFIFDFIQISALVYFLLTGPAVASNIVLLLVQILAIVILFVAAYQMRRTRYYRVPDIGRQSELVMGGIYAYVRNPMYLSQLLFCGALMINTFSIDRLLVYLLYSVNFILKIKYEESLLSNHFSEFEKYKKTSWRLIPMVY